MAPQKRPAQAKTGRVGRHSDIQDMEFDVVENAGVEEAGEPEAKFGQDDKSIPGDLLVRLLNTFFEKDDTKISRDANAAVAKYMDVFVKEAIARTAHERSGSFLEVSATSLYKVQDC